MKKLTIAAAIVCAAVASQAATLNWSVINVAAHGDDASSDDYAAFFINSADVASITAANLVEAITTYGHADNYGTTGLWEGGTDGTIDGLSENSTVTGYLVVIDALTAANAKNFYVTEALSAESNNMGVFTPSQLNYDASATSSPGAWQSATAVPEPTSGLLLLLGMAGLALRRRRA